MVPAPAVGLDNMMEDLEDTEAVFRMTKARIGSGREMRESECLIVSHIRVSKREPNVVTS